jgi:hypothetical protein
MGMENFERHTDEEIVPEEDRAKLRKLEADVGGCHDLAEKHQENAIILRDKAIKAGLMGAALAPTIGGIVGGQLQVINISDRRKGEGCLNRASFERRKAHRNLMALLTLKPRAKSQRQKASTLFTPRMWNVSSNVQNSRYVFSLRNRTESMTAFLSLK